MKKFEKLGSMSWVRIWVKITVFAYRHSTLSKENQKKKTQKNNL